MKTKLNLLLVAGLFLACASFPLRAQLVADGATNNINTGINLLPGDLVVGTNAGNTSLRILGSGVVTNATGVIGFNAGSTSNEVRVNGVWRNVNALTVGRSGSDNSLVIVNAGRVLSQAGSLGSQANSSNNLVSVTSSGSIWTNAGNLILGSASGAVNNQLIIRDGGEVWSANGWLGMNDPGATGNTADVAGTNSLWSNSGDLYIGAASGGNLLIVGAGGTLMNANARMGFEAGADDNLAVVSGAGSLWTNTGNLYVGDQGANNQLFVTNAGNVFLTGIRIGNTNTAVGNQAVVTGTNSLLSSSGAVYVGYEAAGNSLVIADGASVANNNGYIGNNTASASNNWVTVSGEGSLWNLGNNLYLGYEGSGNQLTISDGAVVADDTASLGYNSGSDNNSALITGSNSAWNNSGNLLVGFDGAGNQLTVSNGASVANTFGYLGYGTDSGNNSVIVTSTNSAWNNSTNLYVGNNGSDNQLVVSNGAVVANSFGYLGYTSGSSNNTALITGDGSVWANSGKIFIGTSGNGNQLVVSNGAVVVNSDGSIGYNPGSSNNTALITGVGSVWTNSGVFYVGFKGDANSLFVTNSGTVFSAGGRVGDFSGSDDNLAVLGDGGSWINSKSFRVGNNGNANVLLLSAGGTASAADSAYIGQEGGSNNLLHVDGGALTVVTNLDVRRGTLLLDSGTVTAATLLATNATEDGGGFIVFNGGTLSVSNSTVDNGTALIVGNGSSAATYQLTGNGLHTFNDGLTVANNAQLIGNGTVSGTLTVQNGGVVGPGTSVGLLVLSNSPTLEGSIVMEIGKTGATLTNDVLQVLDTLAYGGTLIVSDLGPDELAIGDSFQLFSATGYSGEFSSITLPALSGGLTWSDTLLTNGTISVAAFPAVVTTTADEDDGNSDPANGAGTSLREAVNYAVSGATITFTNTLSGATIVLTNGQITISTNLAIDASSLPDGISVSGNNSSRVFEVPSGITASMSGFTIRDGYAPGVLGGGIQNLGTLIVTNCTFTSNSAANGGGLGNQAGIVTVVGCTFATNSATSAGGGLSSRNAGSAVTIIQSTFTGNIADASTSGGGAVNASLNSDSLYLDGCTITENSATAGSGGGVRQAGGTVTITNCIVAENTSDVGGTEDLSGTITTNGPNLIGVSPQLAPLGDYGGPTQTMPPLPGSPAIDGATNGTAYTVDQRGFPREVGAFADLGAVETQPTIVLNTDDSGPGSLRDVVGAASPEFTVTFTNTLSGQTIVLTNGHIMVDKNLTIDGSALAGGVSVDGNANSRIFEFTAGTTNVLDGLTLINGLATGGPLLSYGGAIFVNASAELTITNSTLSGNTANIRGGGIYNAGALTVQNSTLSGNTADNGGGLYDNGIATLIACTFSVNTATSGGGGVNSWGDTTIIQSTFYGNSAGSGGGGAVNASVPVATLNLDGCTISGNSVNMGGAGGGILRASIATVTINNCIVAGNTLGPMSVDISGTVVTNGPNLIGGSPNLAPLGDYGGPTQTMPPLPGSPAIDGATNGTAYVTDQRGFPRAIGAFPDLGAVEGVYNPVGPTLIDVMKLGDGSVRFGFTNYSGMIYSVLATTNITMPINTWLNIGTPVEAPPGTFQFIDTEATNYLQRYYRVEGP